METRAVNPSKESPEGYQTNTTLVQPILHHQQRTPRSALVEDDKHRTYMGAFGHIKLYRAVQSKHPSGKSTSRTTQAEDQPDKTEIEQGKDKTVQPRRTSRRHMKDYVWKIISHIAATLFYDVYTFQST